MTKEEERVFFEAGINDYIKSFKEAKMKEWDDNHKHNPITQTQLSSKQDDPFDLSGYEHYKGNNKNDYQNRPAKKTYVFAADGVTLIEECTSRGRAARVMDIAQNHLYYYLNKEKIYNSKKGSFIVRDYK